MRAAETTRLLQAVEAERGRYVSWLRRRVGGDAEDVYQQCLVRALEHADELRDATLVRAWFWRVLRNAAADHHASRVARETRHAALADLAPTPEARASVCACALGLLSKLPPAQSEILRRVDVEDERVVDAARALGITPDNAGVRLHRARKALRERLSGCCRVGSVRQCYECECPDESHA